MAGGPVSPVQSLACCNSRLRRANITFNRLCRDSDIAHWSSVLLFWQTGQRKSLRHAFAYSTMHRSSLARLAADGIRGRSLDGWDHAESQAKSARQGPSGSPLGTRFTGFSSTLKSKLSSMQGQSALDERLLCFAPVPSLAWIVSCHLTPSLSLARGSKPKLKLAQPMQ